MSESHPEASLRKIINTMITKNKITSNADALRVQNAFLNANGFEYDSKWQLGYTPGAFEMRPVNWRFAAFSKDGKRFFCSPSYKNPDFIILDIGDILTATATPRIHSDGDMTVGIGVGSGRAVGGVSAKSVCYGVKVTTRNPEHPVFDAWTMTVSVVPLSTRGIDAYKRAAEEIAARLTATVAESQQSNQIPNAESQPISVAEKIRMLAQLKDEGLLTEEEYAAAKAKELKL